MKPTQCSLSNSSAQCTLKGTHSTVVSSPGLCFTTQHLDSSHTDKSIQSTSFEGPPRFPECENDDDGDEKTMHLADDDGNAGLILLFRT